MHIWTDIVVRELAMLLVLAALGSGPAAFLGPRFDAAARTALAPVFGLCVGTSVFTTLLWFAAVRDTYWLLPILALLSIGVALGRGLRSKAKTDGRSRPAPAGLLRALGLRDALALAFVCVVVAAPLSYTLHERHSVGPFGFEVWDSVGYTAEADGMVQQSLPEAKRGYGVQAGHSSVEAMASASSSGQGESESNFVRSYWAFYAAGNQNLDAAPLSANVNELIGLHATDTQSLFLIVFLVTGALGAFAAVRYAAPRPWWAAPLAGSLFAGPFFMQLIADGSQAATCGLALILPIAAVGADALRERRVGSLVLLALLAAGLIALYPLFVSGVALSAAVVLLSLTALAWWRGRLTARALLVAGLQIGGVLTLAILFNLVSFSRDVSYWHDVLRGGYFLAGLPQYHLPYSVLPGWLLQTREFYFLTELGSASVKQVLLGVVLPVLFIAAIVFGLRRGRAGLIVLPLVLVCLLQAEYTSAIHGCSYCTDRALLPLAPVGIGLLVLGIVALVTASSGWLRWAGIAVAIVALIAVGARTRQERLRFSDGAYFLDAGSRGLLGRLPSDPSTVDIEGYGESPHAAPGELPLVYFLASENNHQAVSLATEYEDYSALAYVGGPNPANPQLHPGYRYVLTRYGGVDTDRRTVARTGPIALEERRRSLDATVVAGLATSPIRLDGTGLPWVEGPLHLILTGGGSAPAWIELRFQRLVPVTVPPQPGVRVRSLAGGTLVACARARGTAPVRRATITLLFGALPGLVPNEPFAIPGPTQGVQLTAIHAVARC